jgi:NAD+ kinase
MKALIFGTSYRTHHRPSLEAALRAMDRHGIAPYAVDGYWREVDIDRGLHAAVKAFVDFDTTPVDVVIAFGGDGTVLGAVTLIGEREIPVMGINLGRLGFLASIEARHTESAIESFARGRVRYDQPTMLLLETQSPVFEGMRMALNDFTLHKRDNSSMITLHTYIDGELLNSFWADGLIVSTPTGSTGYSLSCGGPIVFPPSASFVITPVAPHNLTVRPIVIPDSSVISFEVEGRAENFLCTLDSRFEIVTAQDALTVRKADTRTRLIQLDDYTFIRTLQDKLNWGRDTRN